jgi:exonuclease SbcC
MGCHFFRNQGPKPEPATAEQRACEKRAYIESELKKLKEKLSFLKEKLKNLKFEPALLQDSQGKLQRLRNRFLELKEKKKLLEGKLIELNRRFNVLAQERLKERRDNLALKLKELNQATKALADRLSGSVPKVWQNLEELELKFNQLKRLKERQLRIETEVKKLPEYLESVRRRNEKLNRLKKDIAQLKETLSGLDFEVENFKKLENSLTFQRKKVERLKSEVSKLEGIVDTLEKRRINIQTKLKEKEKALSLVPVVDDVIGVVDAVTDTLHPERGFLREVRDNLLPVISGYCEEFFEEFGFALGGLELSEDLTVSFSSRSSASHILELSGGQQVAFALSLRFAMARYFSHTFDLLILDEPTVHLDSLRKQALVDLLLALKVKIPQMIVVTHDPELEAVGDKVIRVKNTGAFSEVFEDASFAV